MTEIVDKSWDLSLYELHRTPQEAITDTTEIAVSPKSLQSELTCPICLDMLTSTMTTKECLHRFCADCIITALRSGNKECPTCRKKLVSKRSLRPDPNFDQLVAKIFPDREEYEEQQEKVLAILSRTHSQQLMSTIGDAIKAQAAHVKMINRKKNLTDYDDLVLSPHIPGTPLNPGTPDSETVPYRPRKKKKANVDAENGEGTSGLQSNDIEIIFKAHTSFKHELIEKLGENATRYIKTTIQASVEHLSKYLRLRLEMELNVAKKEIADPPSESMTCEVDEPKEDVDGDAESCGEAVKAGEEGSAAPTVDESGDASKRLPNGGDNATQLSDIKFYVCPTPGQYIELTGPETLEMVVEDYWKYAKPLELHYLFTME